MKRLVLLIAALAGLAFALTTRKREERGDRQEDLPPHRLGDRTRTGC